MDKIAREKWFDKTNKEHYFQGNENTADDDDASDADVSVTSASSARQVTWCGHQVLSQEVIQLESHFANKKKNYDSNTEILLDTGSTFSIFCSKDLVTDIRDAEVKIKMHTSAGSRLIEQEATLGGFGTVYFNQANIIALKDLRWICRTYSIKREHFICIA